LEYVNPLAGLGMVLLGLILLTLGYFLYSLPPIVVGLALVLYYRKYLQELMGVL
jgi:hypothetical protein